MTGSTYNITQECNQIVSTLKTQCSLPNMHQTTCSAFVVNLCNIPLESAQQSCIDGDPGEFYRTFPCYCDDRCLSKWGATVSLGLIGLTLLIGLSCVFARAVRKPPKFVEIERRLNISSEEKPDPRVGECSMAWFKWMPFTVCISVTTWFVVSSVMVIIYNGSLTVSEFEMAYMFISTMFMVFWLLSNLCLIFNGIYGIVNMTAEIKRTDVIEHSGTLGHIIVLPNYKEELDMMRATIARLNDQHFMDVKKNVTVVLAMEQGEEGHLAKGLSLREEFLETFKDVIITCHPRLPNEQAGKSSNMKWAFACIKQFALSENAREDEPSTQFVGTTSDDGERSQLIKMDLEYFEHPDIEGKTVATPGFSFDPNQTVITLMDADALCHPRFLATLSQKFESEDGPFRHTKFWQCPIAFYENLPELDFLNRASSIIMAFNELANTGFIDLGLVGSNPRMPVNTYSMSWRLFDLIDGGDNFVVADESHNLIKAFHLTKGLAKLEPIFLPISVYAVTSDDFLTGFFARFQQIKRWIFGNAFEFAFWSGRYIGCSRSPNWSISILDVSPIMWRLFIYGSVNLIQPLFFCVYGLSWLFYLQTPYFQTLSTSLITLIMTTFMVINISIFALHWQLVDVLNIEEIKSWPLWKKILVTSFDAIIGIGATTVFYVFAAGIAANAQLLCSSSLEWGTEGRAKRQDNEEEDAGLINERKIRSKRTLFHAVTSTRCEPADDAPIQAHDVPETEGNDAKPPSQDIAQT